MGLIFRNLVVSIVMIFIVCSGHKAFSQEKLDSEKNLAIIRNFQLFGKVTEKITLSNAQKSSISSSSKIRYLYSYTPTPNKKSMSNFLAVLRDSDDESATIIKEIFTSSEIWVYPIAIRNDHPLKLDVIRTIDIVCEKHPIYNNSEVVLLKSIVLCEYFERKKGWGRNDKLDDREKKALSQTFTYLELLQKDQDNIIQSWGFVMESYLRAITRDFPAARSALNEFQSFDTGLPCLDFVRLLERSLHKASQISE